MREAVKETIEKHSLFAPGQKILVAVSGGPDSLCLLHLLQSLAATLEITLHVAHINHSLRPESAVEAREVKKMAIRVGLPVTVRKVNVKKIQAANGLSLQDAARQVRYRALLTIAKEVGAVAIATGHHRDDRVETLLMRLLSGSGLEGLKGIPVRRRLAGRVELVRPLSDVTREEIEDYCRSHKLPPLWDPTNRRTDYLRNRVRLKLVPFLEAEFGAHINRSLARSADLLGQDADFLAEQGAQAFATVAKSLTPGKAVLEIAELFKLPAVLQNRVIRQALWHSGAKRPGQIHVAQVLSLARQESPSAMCPLPGGVVARREYGLLFVDKPIKQAGDPDAVTEIRVPGRTYLPCCGQWLEAEYAAAVSVASLSRNEACLDAQKLTLPLTVRARKPGDRMQPLGATGTRKIKKILADRKVPLARRSQIPLIVTSGKIAWLGGVEIAEEFKVTQETETILCLKLLPK